ncbi:LA_2168 family protein [Leptospira sarikeiensis]|uniref:Alginate export domain-containing protein n=1 Tax=Leptospira sarikeiensis TaxID=2484943 RepID=A0A4V3JRD3_9LEPT|nr:hypothetical protein [Leptospira sarikeiensis]TGL59555.1 hypothetical protein EHQ64_15810 [Leptospira sarikeiensis]
MKILILIALFFISVELFADPNPKTSNLEVYFQWILFRTQGRISEEKGPSKISGISQPAMIRFLYENHSEKFQINLDWTVVTVNMSGLLFLPGENAYFGILYKNFLWGLGRKSDPKTFPAWVGWKDGVEGIFVETETNRIRVRFDLLDLYRGFPLFENQWLKLQGRGNFLPKIARDELVQETNSSFYSESRYRAGFTVSGNRDDRVLYQFRVRYLSLGDWGRFGSDTKESRSETIEGDRDYLVEWKFGIGFVWKYFYLSSDLFLSRGLDKTAYHPNRPERSLPISGEAVRLDLGFYNKNGKLSFFGFLPDREKRSSNGEILELGFVGMGSSPISNPLLQQVWGFYPSSWITERGLEREDTKFPGKRPAAFLGVRYEFDIFGIFSSLHFTYISFLKEDISSSGSWSASKSILGNQWIREAGLQIIWKPLPEENTKLELDLGGFESDFETGLKQWYLLLKIGAAWK